MCDKQEQNADDTATAASQPADGTVPATGEVTPADVTASQPAGGAGQAVDEATQAADDLARELLHGLGFCGHYLHFRNGGMSGRAPIICLIAKRGGQMTQQELGASFELKPGSLSEVLNKMETCGLIERKRNPEDRRQLTVRLTDAGFEQARLEQEGRTKFRAEAFTCLDDAEKLQLLDMLKRIRTRWEELDA